MHPLVSGTAAQRDEVSGGLQTESARRLSCAVAVAWWGLCGGRSRCAGAHMRVVRTWRVDEADEPCSTLLVLLLPRCDPEKWSVAKESAAQGRARQKFKLIFPH